MSVQLWWKKKCSGLCFLSVGMRFVERIWSGEFLCVCVCDGERSDILGSIGLRMDVMWLNGNYGFI